MASKQSPRSTLENLFISSRKDSEGAVSKRFDAWWKHYKQDNCTPITDLFYGYSITSCECPTCGCTTYSMSSFNTLHTTLTLTRIRVSYSLLFQQWNKTTNELRFTIVSSECVLQPSATVQQLKKKIDSIYSRKGFCCVCILYSGDQDQEMVGRGKRIHF